MRSRAGTKNLGYGSISQVGNGFQSDVNRSFDRSELIVNAEPDVPLKVPLDINSLRYDNKAKLLKQKNLDTLENWLHDISYPFSQEVLEASLSKIIQIFETSTRTFKFRQKVYKWIVD